MALQRPDFTLKVLWKRHDLSEVTYKLMENRYKAGFQNYSCKVCQSLALRLKKFLFKLQVH